MSNRTRVPMDLHEGTISHVAPIPEGVEDLETAGLMTGIRLAREEAEKLLEAQRALKADATLSPESAALRVRTATLQSAERIAKRLDAPRAQATAAVESYERATHAPVAPRDPAQLNLEAEIRANLKSMSESERKAVLADAFREKNLAVIGAVLRGPAFLCGLTTTEQEIRRREYRRTFHPKETADAERRRRALEAFDRAGTSFVRLAAELTDDPLAKRAEAAVAARETAEAALKAAE